MLTNCGGSRALFCKLRMEIGLAVLIKGEGMVWFVLIKVGSRIFVVLIKGGYIK